MLSKRTLLSVLCISVMSFMAFIPKDDDPLDRLVAALQKWTEIHSPEKVYLHMDKSYYILGDTIWFKGYVTVGSRHQLSAQSGALYVDLITEKDSVVKSLKLPVTAGMVMGDFSLDGDLDAGNYRIRAYTQWMRNAGDAYFFDRTFSVGTTVSHGVITTAYYDYKSIDGQEILTGADGSKGKVRKDFPIKAGMAQSDVQFFPESGNLVSDVLSRVAFKVTGVDGVGVMVKGVIVDNEQKEVAAIETLRAGMGSFMIRPEPGKSYTSKIRFADGTERIVPLPKAVDDGYVLSVYQPNRDSILVRIRVSSKTLAAAKEMPLLLKFIAQSGGEIVTTSTVNISRQLSSFWLQKKSFPSGIAQFTLFNSAGVPLNERLVFIKTKDHMQLTLGTAKQSYKGRERVDVELSALDKNDKPVAGNFSVSVVDADKAPVDEDAEHTIFSDLLLTSDLQGYVEKPNYYFSKETDDVNRALDNLMLTQGYRRFMWKDIAEADTLYRTPPRFQKEGLGIEVSGFVRSLNAKPLSNAKVTLMASKAGILESATADANGRFSFKGLVLRDSVKFALQARTAKNGAKLEVTLDSLPKVLVGKNKNIGDVDKKIPERLKIYIENGKKQEEMYERTGQLNRTQRLKEVQVSAKNRPSELFTQQGPVQIPEGHADQTINMLNEKVYANLGIMLRSLLPNVKFLPFTPDPLGPTIYEYPYVGVPMNIVLDGRTLDPIDAGGVFDNTTLHPADIAKIDVVKNNAALIGMLGGPTLLIYTKKDKRKVYDPSIVNFSPKGLNAARVFYSPRYAVQSNSAIAADFRSTIYWNPNLKTYSTGKTSFNFFNADGPGDYKVIVEGINAAGELGRVVYHYRVVSLSDREWIHLK